MRIRGALVIVALIAGRAPAHELDPAYLGLTETAPEVFAVQWKVSVPGGLADALEPTLPSQCRLTGLRRTTVVGEAEIERGEVACPGGLAGLPIEIEGLGSTMTDTLLHIDYLGDASFTARLTPAAPRVVVPQRSGWRDVAAAYALLGIEHILLGIDHLLFVLALLLLVRGLPRLIVTVTAFTIAHSITLGAATLGWLRVPAAPVEAVIALSILLLASELARGRGSADDLTLRFPWIVAFAFGLMHGFGFAGALADVGLPEHAIPLALLFFNLGVELGQLLFIAAALLLGAALRRLRLTVPEAWKRFTAYPIGGVAAFWVFERTAAIV
jgi:hydrogenase/urease accessory protein HupE